MNSIPDLDQLGARWGWKLEDREHLPRVQLALERAEPIGVFQDAGRANWWESFFGEWPHHFQRIPTWPAEPAAPCSILISDRIHPSVPGAAQIIFRPPSLALGITCDNGISSEDLEDGVAELFRVKRLSMSSLMAVASTAALRGEAAIIAFAEDREVPFLAYLESKLGLMHPFLKDAKTGDVCAPAALLASGARELLVPPMRIGAVTLAVARRAMA